MVNKEEEQIIRDDNFIAIMLFSFIFIIIYSVYLAPILFYIFKNCCRKKICVYWIDYTLLILSGIIFIIIYIINLTSKYINNNKIRINHIPDLASDTISTLIIVFLTLMCVTIINSLLFDSILASTLSYKMNKIIKIKEKNLIRLSEQLKDVNVVNILQIKYTCKYNIIFIIIDVAYVVLVFLAYGDLDIERFKGIYNLNYYYNYLLRFFHFSVLLLLIISIFIMNKTKKHLLKKHYYSEDRIAQKIYNVYFNQIIYFTDILSFKLISDLIMNIPAFLFLSKKQFDTASLVISELSIFIYIFFGGSEYLIMDKNNKAAKLSKTLKCLFCLKKLDFHFGERDHNFIKEQFKFEYTNEEQDILNKLDMTIVDNIENNMLDFDEKEKESFNNGEEEFYLNESSENIFFDKSKKLEFKTVSEFYLIQKLMMLYFKENKKIYESNSDIYGEKGFNFSIGNTTKKQKINTKLLNPQEKNDYITKIEKLSRISILDSKKLKNSLKYASYNLFCSIEEKEVYEELKTAYYIKEKNNNFKIENILSSELFELFPFYQVNINSLIKSLDPSSNVKIFNKFVNRNRNKLKDRISRFSVKSTYGNDNIQNETKKDEDKQEIENNLYYTNDLYLMYEIFEINEFIDYQKLKNIILEYNKYLLSVIKNMNYSFLPLIIGVFNIEIFNCRNIIILYRNPLYFTNFNNFNHWINFYLNEESEKMKASTLFNDIIDLSEIKIKNILELNDLDSDEIKQILNNDFLFIKKVKDIYPIIHLFIGEESNNNENPKKKKNIDNSLLNDSSNNNKNISDILDKDFSESYTENNMINDNSLFEKEYYYMSGNNIRTIKIYFTNLFRKNCMINLYNTSNYCDFLLDKIIKYLPKNALFNEDKKEGE